MTAIMKSAGMQMLCRAIIFAAAIVAIMTVGAIFAPKAKASPVTCFEGDRVVQCQMIAGKSVRGKKHKRERYTAPPARAMDANGNRIVKSNSGIAVRVNPSAYRALQCVVDYVEAAGIRIKAMRGYGAGTVRASLHPSGRALDINQTDRNITHPIVPRSVSNAAADKCGVISGARWGYADNGHWNLAVHGRKTQEPWPRVVKYAKRSHTQ